MIIKRKSFSGYSETPIRGNGYISAQLYNTMDQAENAVNGFDQSVVGQAPPVKKKTKMVKNIISGIKSFIPRRKHKIKKKHVHS